MRLRQRDLRAVVLRPRVTVTEPDGTTSQDWGDPVTIHGSVQPAGGRMMSEMYGERLAYMRVMYVESTTAVTEGAGVCLDTDTDPDYRVVAIRPWASVKVVDLEKVRS